MKLDQQTIETLKLITVNENRTVMPMLDRALYTKVNKALECLGGKWNRSAKAHVWDCDPGDPIADAVMTGEVRDWKKELQFFPTPKETAQWMVGLLKIQDGERVLEPSAGDGAILRAIRDTVHECRLVAVEINPQMADKMRVSHALADVHCRDFLSLNGELGLFDAIAMNPPFSKGQDIAHVKHAYAMLNPGGRMVAITSPGWTFRTDKKHSDFKAWTYKVGATKHELPAGTFKESGTSVSTVAIHITK
jgi:phospholipid N-methyltransferase